jgi:hypothetical protein
MVNYVPAVYVILLAIAMLATSVARHISLRRVVTRLKQVNMSKWVEMGSPEPTFFSQFRDYTTWQPTNLRVPTTVHTELSMWLAERDYERLRDAEITASANQYKKLGNLQFAIGAIAVCTFLYFRFVAHRVAP